MMKMHTTVSRYPCRAIQAEPHQPEPDQPEAVTQDRRGKSTVVFGRYVRVHVVIK